MKILVAGDFVPQYRVAVQIDEGNYSCLDEVKPCVDSMDYAIVNLESPVVSHVAKPIEKTGPNLRCTEKAMDCLLNAGFNCVTLANNHFRDYGQVGVDDTIYACEKNCIDYVGGGKTIVEASKVLYKDINGERLAIINICENEWSIATDVHGGSAPLNLVMNYYTIQDARQHADYVLVIVHGGVELYSYPTPRMQDTYRFFVDIGADVVVGHHQHVFSGYEIYKKAPIFYGLGNFCFDKGQKPVSDWHKGFLLMLTFGEDDCNFSLNPYIQCAEEPVVKLMRGHLIEEFNANIQLINSVIDDRKELERMFREFVLTCKERRLMEFEPRNRVYRKLCRMQIIPPMFGDTHRKRLLHTIKCDSYREILEEILNEN